MEFDYIIIGAGLSGLTQACILAKEGAKVCLLEKQRIPGGYIQTFTRKKYRFDTGFHYVGSALKHKPLRQLLQYLGIFKSLDVHYYKDDCFFEIANAKLKFSVPSNFHQFFVKLQQSFPQDKIALEKLYDLTQKITSSFRWYDLDSAKSYDRSVNLPTYTLQDWMDKNLQSDWLKQILASFSSNIALYAHEIPIVTYAISLNSIFDHPIWLYDGGDGLVRPFMSQLKEHNVDIHFSTKVTSLNCSNRNISEIITENGHVFHAKNVISTIHPKLIMPMLDDNALRPIFKRNILEMKDSRGSFCLNIVLKEDVAIDPINYIYIVDHDRPYGGVYFNSPSLLNNQIRKETPPQPRLNLCTFVDSAPFMKFRGSKFGKRPQEYKDLKKRYTDMILKDIDDFIPDLAAKIDTVYSSSPLTNEHYTGSIDGSSFGISHDVYHQTIHRPSPRTRIRNLFFAGQSINMPGICGVIVNSFFTAGLLLGDDYLFQKVKSAN